MAQLFSLFFFFLWVLKLNSSGGGEPYEMDETGLFDEYDGIEDDSDDEDAESSVDLLIRFFQSMFKKVSKRAKKASRSVLPTVISPQLVSAPFLLCFVWNNRFFFYGCHVN